MPVYSILPQQSRQGAYDSPGVLLPAGISRLTVRGVMPQADFESAANSFDLAIFQSIDGGLTWRESFSARWRGDGAKIGPRGDANPAPGATLIFQTTTEPTRWKISLSVPTTMQLGFEAEVA